MWSIIAFFALIFLVASVAIIAVWTAIQKRNGQSTGESDPAAAPSTDAQSLLRQESLSSISFWEKVLARMDIVTVMQKHIAQADLSWTVGRVTAAMLLTGTVALLVLVQTSWVPLWVATGGAWLFAILPYLYIVKRRAKRFNQFRENFPDAMDSLSRGLKAGYPFIAALDMVANETLPPVSTEMRRTFAEATLGIPLERALANLGERIPILEVSLFAAAIHLHSRTGGKLSDVMATLSENMREQVALRGEVRAIAAHGRLTGIILTIIPIAIAVLMAVVSPTYIGILLAHPYGKHLIAGAALCLITAHFVIRRIVDIKI